MVATGFRGVGGSLLASLRPEYPADRLAGAFRSAGIDKGTVVAFVRPAQWIDLFQSLDHAR
jgi:23S rRNA (adenine-N6)-dimethyltransferase